MSTINPYQDIETRKQYRNLTNTQQKNISAIKEGVVVNSLIKDKEFANEADALNLEYMYDNLVIPDKMTRPDTYEKQSDREVYKSTGKTLLPIVASTVGFFGLLAGSMYALKRGAELKTNLKPWQTLQEITKHVSVNDEPHLAMLLMIRDPSYRNIMGALGVFVLSSIGFVGKNYVDGVKEVWVRKKQADVQRDLQEKLIEVETKSFSGKMQILRNMLTEKAKELDSVLHRKNIGNENMTFRKFISFKHSEVNKTSVNKEKNTTSNVLTVLGVGLGSILIGGLSWLALHNLRKSAKICNDFALKTLNNLGQKIAEAESPSVGDLERLKNTIVSLNLKESEVKAFFDKTKQFTEKAFTSSNGKTYESYKDYVMREVQKLTDEGAEAIAGKPSSKPVIFSYTGDLCSHLYNMIVNPESPLLKLVFAGMAAVTTTGYVGAKTVEAIKEAQVIKENAKTELDLQKRLVSVELKNFETKKRSVIEPMMNEFRVQAMNGKDKNELKTRAENILYEIKNGPPFVYS